MFTLWGQFEFGSRTFALDGHAAIHIQVDWVLFTWAGHGCRGPAIEFFSPPIDYWGPWCGSIAFAKGLNHAMQNPIGRGVP